MSTIFGENRGLGYSQSSSSEVEISDTFSDEDIRLTFQPDFSVYTPKILASQFKVILMPRS